MLCNKWASLSKPAKICRAWRIVHTHVSPFSATRTMPEGASKGGNQCSTSDTHPICFAIYSRTACQDLVKQISKRERKVASSAFIYFSFNDFIPHFIAAHPPPCVLLLNTALKPLCNPQYIFQARFRALPFGFRKISWQKEWQYIKLKISFPHHPLTPIIHFFPHCPITCSNTTADESTGWCFPKTDED